jgi:predicted phage terminase large subunit-like protein
VRIYTHSAEVQNLLFFPANWERRWPEFARDMKSYRKEGRNAHDDAEDACTGIIERFIDKMQPINVEKLNEIFF